jgi:sec-independent protein translocase protein TatA
MAGIDFQVAGIDFQELLIIFLIIALLFGAKKIQELAKGLGQALRKFRKGMKDEPEKEKNTKNPDSDEKIIEKTKSEPEEKITKTT